MRYNIRANRNGYKKATTIRASRNGYEKVATIYEKVVMATEKIAKNTKKSQNVRINKCAPKCCLNINPEAMEIPIRLAAMMVLLVTVTAHPHRRHCHMSRYGSVSPSDIRAVRRLHNEHVSSQCVQDPVLLSLTQLLIEDVMCWANKE
uniref:Type III interferon 4 n=1 Tax=Xenopus tropicalis TaxID=8364 RepID=A0A1B1FFS1_XENTR|nr:type III interferon 4 [Xenopus tropicalis]